MPITGTYRIYTDKNKDTVHVIFQGIDPGIIIALGFDSEETPEYLGTAIKVTNQMLSFASFWVRGANRAIGRTGIIGHCLIMFSSDPSQ